MKKITLLLVLFVSVVFTGCGEQTTTSYNNQIVEAHKKLFDANDAFLSSSLNFIGKPESKKDFLKLIASTRNKLVAAQKPVDLLAPLNTDHGLRKTMLEMFDLSIASMDGFEANIDMLTTKDNEEKAATMMQGAFSGLLELDKEIKAIQVEYADANNAQLR
ncbi:hypothetical protein EYY60_02560 [Flavobacterium zhairuonense]|uniref:hypothetical protein n=1 Tax=Flavobacterium zhairuonense TaxID=2493631 RepID=UPI001053B611|nr:hypothetical protein [Flavobacterium zhairuonense]KAF2515388.1 hypothetical protein EYY60_02560 [Flavobacterium zhairuonense]